MIPVVPGGRSREGVDCWGLVRLIYKEQLGIDLPAYEGVDWKRSTEVWQEIARQESSGEWDEIDRFSRRPFDVVTLRIGGVPWHIGVLFDKDRFIHADPVRGVRIERLDAIHWRNRVVGYHRLRDVDSVVPA